MNSLLTVYMLNEVDIYLWMLVLDFVGFVSDVLGVDKLEDNSGIFVLLQCKHLCCDHLRQ